MKEAGVLALKAGVDVGISFQHAYMMDLIENVKEGKVNIEAGRSRPGRILNIKFKLGLFENPYVDPDYAAKRSDIQKKIRNLLYKQQEKVLYC